MKYRITAIVAMVAALASCTKKEDPNVVKSVSITPAEVKITEGTTKSLEVDVQPSTAVYDAVTWSSDDTDVAKISRKGLLTAVKEGSTTVHATVAGITADCKVTIIKSTTPVTGVNLDKESATIGIGEKLTLNAEVLPADAGLKTVTWASSAKDVASVSADGEVAGIKEGKATITVTTDDGGFEAKCEITVVNNTVSEISFAGGSESAKVVDVESNETLAVNYVPKTAANKDLEWSTSDASIATVQSAGEGLGKVTFLKKTGAVVITAKCKANPSVTASQSYFVKDTDPMYIIPTETIYAGRKTEYKFNSAVYKGVSSVKWTYEGKEASGESAMLAVDKSGENTIVMKASFGSVEVEESFTVNAEDWYMEIDLPEGMGGYNTVPVFSLDGKTAYVLLSGPKRALQEIKLDERRLGWTYVFPSNETASNNGGNIAVNPKTGDIICPGSARFYCITPAGDLKWKTEQLYDGVTRSPTMYSGCGPAFSNDCKVVFSCGTPRGLFAIDMADGRIIDKVTGWSDGTNNPESNQCQLGVYGDNNICLHLKGVFVVFHHFDGSKFSELGRCNTIVAEKYPTDLSSCAITSDQKHVFFSGYSVFSVDLEKMAPVAGIQDGTKWHNSPSFTEDGHMYQIQGGYAGANAAVLYYDLKPALTTGTCVYKNGIAGDDGMKFSSSPVDRNGNAYFCFWDKSEGKMAFYVSKKGAEAEKLCETSDKTMTGGAGFFQGSFNFGNGYIIATTGGVSGGTNYAGKVLVRCIDAERGHGWSGHGGDVFNSKNANLIYAK